MFCINCGIQLPEGAIFCYKCGFKQEIKITHPLQKKEFSYSHLVNYEYERVEMVENHNQLISPDENRAFVIVQVGGKLGAYDECFERLFVPCDYDSISICTQSYAAMFKVSKNNRYYLFENDKIILDKGYDDIYVQDTRFEPCAIEFKNNGKYGFRLRKRIPSGSIGTCSYSYELYDAVYDSLMINTKEHVVLVKEGGKYGLVGPWGTKLPCMFDSIKIERRPAPFEKGANLQNLEKGYERRWLILKYNGVEHEYPDLLIREPNRIKYGFDIMNYGYFFLMES